MPRNDEISRMTDEVVRDMKKNSHVDFRQAFAWAAHRRNIYYGANRYCYVDHLRKVERRFKARERSERKKKLPPRPPRTPKAKTPRPRLHIRGSRPFIDLHPERGYLYADDEGFTHSHGLPYLPEAPC